MTKASAFYSFWSQFGIPAYEENSVYSMEQKPSYPYLTYELNTDSDGNSVALSCSLWYRSSSLVKINEKTEEISKAIGMGGIKLKCDNGYIWLKKGNPFAQTMGDSTDDFVKRKLINITADFLTIN